MENIEIGTVVLVKAVEPYYPVIGLVVDVLETNYQVDVDGSAWNPTKNEILSVIGRTPETVELAKQKKESLKIF